MICSVLTFALIGLGGNIKKQIKDGLDKIVRKAWGIVDKEKEEPDCSIDVRQTKC